MAAELGVSESTLQQAKQIANKVAPDVQAAILADPVLRETVAESTTDVLALARMDEAEQQRARMGHSKGAAPDVETAPCCALLAAALSAARSA